MADFVSSPQVLDNNTILLYGNYYHINGPVKSVLGTEFPPKQVQGDYSRNDNPIISTYAVSDLRGGMGVWRYTDYEHQKNRYWTGQNIDALWAGAITLGPLATSISKPAGVANGADSRITFMGTTLVVIFASGSADVIYNYTSGAWSAAIDTLPGPVQGEPVFFNARVFYPLGSNGYSYQPDVTATATDSTTVNAQDFEVWDGNLYAIDTSFSLWRSTTGTTGAANWTQLASIPLDTTVTNPFGRLYVYDDPSGDAILWCHTHAGLWVYDAVANKWFQSRLQEPYFRRNPTAPSTCNVYRGSFYVAGTNRKIWKLTMMSNALVVEDASPDFPDGLPAVYQGEWRNFTATSEHLFMLNSISLANTGILPGLFCYNGLGWHPLFYSATTAAAVLLSGLGLVNDQTSLRLYFSDMGATTTANVIRWINLVTMSEHPLVSTTRTYAASGNIELPYFDGNYAEQQKCALALRVKVAGATATETVQMAYRIDGSTGSYTNIGSAITSTAEQTIRFGTNNVGLAFKSIQLRASLVRGGTTTAAPKIEYIALDYIRLPEVRRGFIVTIDCTQHVGTTSPQEQLENLWTAISTSTLGTFAYRDDTGGTRSYLAKVLRPEETEGAGRDVSGLITVYIQEVTDNTGA